MIHSQLTTCTMLILLSVYLSGNNIHNPDIDKADKIEISFFRSKQQKNYFTSDKAHLFFFKDLINKSKNSPNLVCDTTGEIIYLKDNRKLFNIYFSTKITGSKFDKNAIAYSVNNNSIVSLPTYNVGMMLDEIFYSLNKKNSNRFRLKPKR